MDSLEFDNRLSLPINLAIGNKFPAFLGLQSPTNMPSHSPTAAQGTSSICVHDRPNKLPEAAAARTRQREAHIAVTTLATLVVKPPLGSNRKS